MRFAKRWSGGVARYLRIHQLLERPNWGIGTFPHDTTLT